MGRFPNVHARVGLRYAVLGLLCATLGGCFDLAQNVSIGRDGSGQYDAQLTAQGFIGDAIARKPPDLTGPNRAQTTMTAQNGNVTERSVVAFKSLSELAFSDQEMGLYTRGHALFGIGPAEMTFHCSQRIDRARAEHGQNGHGQNDANGLGMRIAQGILGNHTYVFRVTVPGSVERAAPVVIGGITVAPEVTGDYWHHTVTWRMPLYLLVSAQAVDFDVDFSAYGWFTDSRSRRV